VARPERDLERVDVDRPTTRASDEHLLKGVTPLDRGAQAPTPDAQALRIEPVLR
jgi:hypothetical protein